MLDADTKRRIDTARDILVGKVPDPKSQVEQITIALIYKFMDDIDAESEEFGGERTFFAGDFARYGWANLIGPGIGGQETLNLYAEGIARMPENPGIPELFRNIFDNAYLPYRDPETLRAFLKVINEFSYDHPERLGDAFEYLLSVLDSQGDAGQFRTPRHIIDFIVEVIDPKNGEAILDPACGTAGFLISSYKHILKANTDSDGASTLTPDDMERLAANLQGYDISPDFVRLSLVNMYLHGFAEPLIAEYDTLTSDERWNEYADVILANPPFMTPKGGIRPHNRFSVQSKRSEVLFVDYMAEHLTPSGRAGIIVPEGIIFQSQKAHKQLRKMLVEDYLVAVVSLPAGVFNPYSGVKTSILILDRTLARKSDTIAFFKIENDGYDLGAQRRPIAENDLPQVACALRQYLAGVTSTNGAKVHEAAAEYRAGPSEPGSGKLEGMVEQGAALIAPKSKLAEHDYNLSGERYQASKPSSSKFPFVAVGEMIQTINPPRKIQKRGFATTGQFPIIDQSQNSIAGWTDDESAVINPKRPLVIFGDHTCIVKLANEPFAQGADGIKILQTVDSIDPRYMFYTLQVRPLDSDGYKRHFSKLKALKIPVPPLEVQQGIVAEIEGYQKVIDGARAVVENYRLHIAVDPEWPLVAVSEVASVASGFGFPIEHQGNVHEAVPFLKVSDMNLEGNEIEILSWNNAVSKETLTTLKAKSFPKGTIIFPKIGAAIATNKKRILTRQSTYDNNVMGIVPNTERILSAYLYSYLVGFDLSNWASTAQPPSMRKTVVETHELPLPTLETQQAIVAEFQAEQALVSANRELIARFERKIQDTIGRLWRE